MPVSVSLNTVVGITNQKTPKLMGKISGHNVIVMVDPGATHNFISEDVIKKLGIRVMDGKEFKMALGNGDIIKGKKGVSRGSIELGGH